MALCAPSTLKLSIPVFSFIWTSAARELYLYSGKRDLFDRNVEMIRDMTEDVFSRRDPATGLYHTGTGKKRWNFYEWSAGLDNWGREAAPGEYHAAYNLYLIEMLDNCAALTDGSEAERYAERADALRKAVHRNFWDAEKNAYATVLDNGVFGPHYHDHIQYLALRNKVVPDAEIQEKLTATLFAGTLIPATLSALPYLVDAVMPLSPEARTYAADLIRRTYGAMVEKGATTLWETAKGADDFGKAGSLCHGWSSLPVYYQGAEILNGDRACLRRRDGQWLAYGMPYAGSSDIFRNAWAPVRGIVVLRQAPENRVRRMQKREALLCLFPELSMRRWDAEFVNHAMDLTGALLGSIPVYLLECRPDQNAVEVLRSALTEEE